MSSDETLTRAHLAEAIYREVGLSRNDSAAMVEDILEEIVDALTRGEAVKISSFGTFQIRDKAPRTGRNPRTGREAPIPPRRVVVFKASLVLKDRVGQALKEKSSGANC